MRNVLSVSRLKLQPPGNGHTGARSPEPHGAARSGQESRGDPETLTVADIRERLGRRSFGPLLLFAGLVLLTPLAGIPGLPVPLRASSSC
jgi:hypothetical protein